MLLGIAASAYASELDPASPAAMESQGTALRKLQRGIINMAFSPVEIAHELQKETRKPDSLIPNWFIGLGKGTVWMVGRFLSGAYDLVTFPINAPANYGSLTQPEFVWDYLNE